MKEVAPGQRPKESVFYEPVVYLIGRLTGFKPYQPVEKEQVENDAIRLAGYELIYEDDPENPGTQVAVAATDGNGHTWRLKDTSTKQRDGLLRVVGFGWFHQTRHYRDSDSILCAKPVTPDIEIQEGLIFDTLGVTEEEEEILSDPQILTKRRKAIRREMREVEAQLSERQAEDAAELRREIRELRSKSRTTAQEEALEQAQSALYDLLGVTQEGREILHDSTYMRRRKETIRAKMEERRALLTEEQRKILEGAEEVLSSLKKESKGKWALTELGARRAQELREKYEGKITLSAGPNATARHLGQHWNKYVDRIRQHLRRKMPRSAEFDKIDDHMMNYMVRVISRDGLRKRLEEGRTVPPSQLQGWARRSAYTDIRNEGRKPVCRVFSGALTKKEIPLYDPSNWTRVHTPRTINESETLSVNTYAEHGEDDFVGDTIENLRDDTASGNVENSVLDSAAFEGVLDRMSEVLVEDLGEDVDTDWYREIVLDRYVKEMTIREIAEARGLKGDDRKVSVALNRVRDCMMQARDFGELDEFMVR